MTRRHRDDLCERWVFYRRMRRCLEWLTGSKDTVVRMAGVSVSQGRDISRWHPKTRGHMVLAPDERDAAEAERRGAMWCEHYTMFGWPYEGLWLAGLEELWRSIDWVEVTGRLSHVEGYEDMHLAWSRDLIDWQRKADREPWIPTGRPGEWDSGMIYGISRPVIQGDELWFYYDGFDGTHFDPGCFGNMPRWQEWMQAGDAAGRPHLHEWRAWNAMQGAVGLAKLRLDGFAHLEALAVPGILITKPLLMTGRGLGINAAVAGGEVRVEIQDEAGMPIDDGHGLDDCDRFVGDSVRHEVTWRGSGDLERLRGRVVRLRFWLRLANLYSFYLVDGGQSEPSPAQRVTDARGQGSGAAAVAAEYGGPAGILTGRNTDRPPRLPLAPNRPLAQPGRSDARPSPRPVLGLPAVVDDDYAVVVQDHARGRADVLEGAILVPAIKHLPASPGIASVVAERVVDAERLAFIEVELRIRVRPHHQNTAVRERQQEELAAVEAGLCGLRPTAAPVA